MVYLIYLISNRWYGQCIHSANQLGKKLIMAVIISISERKEIVPVYKMDFLTLILDIRTSAQITFQYWLEHVHFMQSFSTTGVSPMQ